MLTKGEGNLEWMVEERDPEYHLLPPDQLLWAGGGGLRGRRVAVAYTTSGTTAAVGAAGWWSLGYSADIFPDLILVEARLMN